MDAPERYGPYVVYEPIGRGGMATVHRAEQPLRDGRTREVALKRLLPTLERERVQLFLDEARLLRYLDHPNIAATYDSGRVFGTYFIAMEYVRGPTLKELIEHCRGTVGSVPQAITLDLAAQLCDALDHAHNRCDEDGHPLGIIHRDVTPANIIISDSGHLKLIDFGLAKAKLTTQQTAVGVIKGKFGYVAPEYTSGKLDLRADLWAVGIIMYELLTSRRLFDGPDAFETMMRVREMPIPRPSIGNPKVTPELDELVMRALQREPQLRWPSAAAMRDGIRALIAQPGNATDRTGVAGWVRWVFEQKRGRPPQLTPKMALPNAPRPAPDDDGYEPEPATEVVSADQLLDPGELEPIVAPATAPEPAAELWSLHGRVAPDPAALVSLPWDESWTLPLPIWRICALALAVFAALALLWRVFG